jgi:hypothetical protein
LGPPDNTLFETCFRLQREASEAAGRYIPLVVENVKGAQKWVGRAAWHFGSFYLWGDVPALMPITFNRAHRSNGETNFHGSAARAATKNQGGSWFNQAHNTESGVGQNPVNGVKVEGVTSWSDYGKPGYKPKGFNVTAAQRYREEQGRKVETYSDPRRNGGKGAHLTSPRENEARKGMSGLRGMCQPTDARPRDLGGPNDLRRFNSKSDSRKAASAQIAKIPFPLAQHIARVFKP